LPINPAALFLDNFHPGSGIDLQTLIESYVQFMLMSAETYVFPVDLEKVFRRHELSVHIVPLDQRGAVTEDLRILINSSDKAQIQKYSQGHELMEILVKAIIVCDPEWLTEEQLKRFLDEKERWCEIGAAEFVMPIRLFFPLVREFGLSLRSAQSLAQIGGVSLVATIRQMLKTNLRKCALVTWYYGYKPTENMTLPLWEEYAPKKKLRVEWACTAAEVDYIFKHKSVELNTAIGKALKAPTGSFFQSYDYLEITSKPGAYLTQAIPVRYTTEDKVLSLIFFDDQKQQFLTENN
jgi:hypothetical protein